MGETLTRLTVPSSAPPPSSLEQCSTFTVGTLRRLRTGLGRSSWNPALNHPLGFHCEPRGQLVVVFNISLCGSMFIFSFVTGFSVQITCFSHDPPLSSPPSPSSNHRLPSSHLYVSLLFSCNYRYTHRVPQFTVPFLWFSENPPDNRDQKEFVPH